MSRYRILILVVASMAGLAWATACGDGATEPPPPPTDPPRPTTVTVSPATARLTALAATVQLTAEVRDQNGQAMAGASVTWASGNAAVATVSAAGLVTAAGNGTATITATAGGVSGTATVTVAQTVSAVRAALVALYNATDGPNWVNNDGWLTDAPLGEWYGVGVDDAGRVVWLQLAGKYLNDDPYPTPHGLRGPIPAELGNLTKLERLDLAQNALTGSIPPELGNLANLTELDLGGNSLTGPIPPELGNFASLERLFLSGNGLSGPIPPELGDLANLTELDLGLNSLSGPIPVELGNLANLTWLWASNNKFTGSIPPELGNLANLTELDLGGNSLTGPIPPELGNFASLERLFLWGNGLSGPIPPELGDLASLTVLGVVDNKLSGPIPQSLLQLDRLRDFHIAGNGSLCVPGTSLFVAWLKGRERHDGASNSCNAADVAALKSLFEANSGPDWTESAGWRGDGAVEEWYGVSADSLGRVTALDLTRNGLSGPLPSNLGDLARMTVLRIGGNDLTGRLPLAMARLPLQDLRYADTQLCAPAGEAFQTWLNAIASHEGTGAVCAALSDRDVLEAIYNATGGTNWSSNRNWLGNTPLAEWHGVHVDGQGRVVGLNLSNNNLSGTIPPELGNLANVGWLELGYNNLSGTIPSELGNLASLNSLALGGNNLSGPIPLELGNLATLESLQLQSNDLSGPIPPELGNLPSLTWLWLRGNNLSGAIPPELGNLPSLTSLWLQGNNLSGAIPPELGNLVTLENLQLQSNDLSGPVPPSFGGISSLRSLGLTKNARLAGRLPSGLTALGQLDTLQAGGTDLCAPSDPAFQAWLEGIRMRWIAVCVAGDLSTAYMTQAVQSREFPVPLVTGERALLRVFLTAGTATNEGIPAVRARFYRDAREIHVEDIPGKSTPIPTEVDESSLSKSANAEIPSHVIQPGLEMVIEVDPNGTLDPALGVAQRIPETGRLEVEVRTVPPFDLTLIPFIWNETHDSTIVDLIDNIAADSENHEMVWETHTLLPVGGTDVTAHEPVLSSSNNASDLLSQTEAIRAMESGTGHYMGMMSTPVTEGDGVANLPGRSSFSIPVGSIMAHELGHNLSLGHAPCGHVENVDPLFPYPDGSIGAWGYDFRRGGALIYPDRPDLMSYCFPKRIGEYHFAKALHFRLSDADSVGLPGPPAALASAKSLLLWGGIDGDSVLYLEPAFVVEAPAVLPDSAGEHRITGQNASGGELFSFSFTMPEIADGDGSSSFAFVLPVQPGWAGNLASITLSGPGGSVTLDVDSDRPMAILRNPRTGQVRGILRDVPDPAQTQAAAADVLGAERGLDMIFSRGIPDSAAWRR